MATKKIQIICYVAHLIFLLDSADLYYKFCGDRKLWLSYSLILKTFVTFTMCQVLVYTLHIIANINFRNLKQAFKLSITIIHILHIRKFAQKDWLHRTHLMELVCRDPESILLIILLCYLFLICSFITSVYRNNYYITFPINNNIQIFICLSTSIIWTLMCQILCWVMQIWKWMKWTFYF